MAGRGSFIESFPLFGYDLDDYDELFAEKIELLLRIRDEENGHLGGQAPLRRCAGLGVYPRQMQDPLPIWIAVGGSPQSVDPGRPARYPTGDRDHRRAAGPVRRAGRALPEAGRQTGHDRRPWP